MEKSVEPVGYYFQLTFSIITFCLLLNFYFCFTGKERWCSKVYKLLCYNKINVYTKWIYCFSLRTDILNVISKFDLHNIIVILCHPNFTFLIHFAGWSSVQFSSVQFSSVAQSCPTLYNPMNRSTPGLPVHHQLPEFTQTHVSSQWCHPAISSSVVPFSSCP